MILHESRIQKRNAELAIQEQPGETFVFHMGDNVVHHLEDIETDIWNAIDGNMTAGDIVTKVCEEYGVDPDRADKEVMGFLNVLAEKGLVRESSDG